MKQCVCLLCVLFVYSHTAKHMSILDTQVWAPDGRLGCIWLEQQRLAKMDRARDACAAVFADAKLMAAVQQAVRKSYFQHGHGAWALCVQCRPITQVDYWPRWAIDDHPQFKTHMQVERPNHFLLVCVYEYTYATLGPTPVRAVYWDIRWIERLNAT